MGLTCREIATCTITDALPRPDTARRPSEKTLETAPDFKDADARPYWRRHLLRRFLQDQKFLVTSWWPSEARHPGFSVPLIVAAAGASGSSDPARGIDPGWQRSLESWTRGERREIAQAFSRLGDSETAMALLGGTYLVSRWAGNERLQRASSLSAEALLSAALYSKLLKGITRRPRPLSTGGGQLGAHPEPGASSNSFPSGHAMGAFAVATVFASEYRDKRWISWMTYGTASLIALSRVGLGRHFPSDVLAGAVLGHSMGRMVAYRGDLGSETAAAGRIEPLIEPRNDGVGVAYRRTW